MKSILIVEDDITYSLMLKTWLEKKGFNVSSTSTIKSARKLLEKESVHLILSDLQLPDGNGISLQKWIHQQKEAIPLIIMTSYAEIQTAVEAIKSGARDYIAKPILPDELLKKIQEALTSDQGIKPTVAKAKTLPENYLEGNSPTSRKLYEYARLVAPTNMSVLITGASGTGKEYVAHRIHQWSKRADKPFMAIDCGAIPRELATSEFFGHVKGSFTGALADKTGAFEAANGGTIFLDEIGNLSYDIQIQLLRVLQERKIKRVGSNQETEIDIRLISATNEDLEVAITNGNFREDLFHRINEFTLHVPDLKERKEDILLFADLFLRQANEELEKEISGFSKQAVTLLQSYEWPGNLRQMKNAIKRATLLAQEDLITPTELSPYVSESQSISYTSIPIQDQEEVRIQEALRQTNNNKSKAAQLLGIDRKTLYNKLKYYRIK